MTNYFIFEMLKKKIWATFQRIIELLPKKLSLSSQKYGFGIRDPRSGIRKKNLFRIPNLVKKAPDPGSGSATLPVSRIQGKKAPDPGSGSATTAFYLF